MSVRRMQKVADCQRARRRLLGTVVGFAGLALGTVASAQPLHTDFAELAARCAPQIHPVTLSALVLQESHANPFAIGINGGTAKLQRQPRNRSEAIATADWLRINGHNFDAGLGQINVKNMGWLGLSVADLFDPCANLRAAGTVLADCYSRAAKGAGAGQTALRSALSCYNTGNFKRGFANGYVSKVAGRVGRTVPAIVERSARLEVGGMGEGQLPAAAATPDAGSSRTSAAPGRGDAFGGAAADVFSEARERQAVENSVTLADRVTVNRY